MISKHFLVIFVWYHFLASTPTGPHRDVVAWNTILIELLVSPLSSDRGFSRGILIVIWGQCDKMVRLFFSIWLFATMQISPLMSQICQSRLSICQKRNKLSKNCQRLVNFCQSGKISPNLVTLSEALLLSFLLLLGPASGLGVPEALRILHFCVHLKWDIGYTWRLAWPILLKIVQQWTNLSNHW